MAYTTLAQGSSVTVTLDDQFDSVEVINRSQDLATVTLTSGLWGYSASPQQHSGRRVYSTSSGGGVITIAAVSGSLQYEYVSASDNRTTLTPSTAIQLNAGGFASGYRTVLFGDSMTDTYETSASGVAGVYDSATGTLTLTVSTHQQAVGWYVVVWNRTQSGAIKGRRLAVASVIDANTFTVAYGVGVANVAASDANWFVRPESWRSAQAFVPWLQAASGQRFNIVYNGAQSGDTTQNAIDRLTADCLAYSPQVVIMQIPGINDTSTGNGNIAEDTIATNQQTIIGRILDTGAKLILLNITPLASGDARATATNMMRVQRLNRRLRDYCVTRSGVFLFDAYRRIVDPADTSGLGFANYLRTADKIHYSMRGGKYIADQLWAQISSSFTSDNSTLPTSALDNYWASAKTLTSVSRSSGVVTGTAASHGYQVGERFKLSGGSESFNEYVTLTAVTTNTVSFVTASGSDGSITGTILLGRSQNLVPNHLLTTATGGLGVAGSGTSSGTFAGNIRVENTAGTVGHVGSVVARADGRGNNQRVVITAAAASNTVSITSDFTTYNATLPTIIKQGRSYVFECELSLTNVSGSNLSEILVVVEFVVGGTTYFAYALNGYAEGATLNSDASGLHIRTAPFVVPAGALGNCRWRVQPRFSAAGTALTLDVGLLRLQESE